MIQRLFIALFFAAAFQLGADTVQHSSLADFRSGTGDGHVDFRNVSGGEIELHKAMSSLGAFTLTDSLPLPLYNAACWANDEAVYLAGGTSLSSSIQGKVYSATFGASGTLDPWQTHADLPAVGTLIGAATWGNYVFVAGGYNGATDILRARMLPGGGLTSFTMIGSLPVGEFQPYLAVLKGHLIFGRGYPYNTAFYSAPIRGDGSLGSWTVQPSRPLALFGSSFVSTARGLFSFGGEDSAQASVFNNVISSSVADDGTLSAWGAPTGATLPSGKSYLNEGESDGYGFIFSIGGRSGMPSPYASVAAYSAALSGGAGLNTWTTHTGLPFSRSAGAIIAGKGYLWYLGGTNDSLVAESTVYSAPITLGSSNAAEGGYQNIFDLGQDRSLTSLSWSATPASAVSVQARSAPDAGKVFGPWSAASTSSPILLAGSARYVEYRVQFSDPGPGSVSVSDVTLDLLAFTATPTSSPTPSPTPTALPVFSCGSYVSQWSTSGNPNGLLWAPSGNFYVVHNAAHAIRYYDSSGLLQGSWGSGGSADGQFNNPVGIARAVNGDFYVTDANNTRIQYFNSAGTFLGKWGSAGTGNGQFGTASSSSIAKQVAVDSSGKVYVTNANRVQYFSSTGTYLGQWGSFGSGDGQFNQSYAIALSPSENRIYVSDYNNQRIQYFSLTGTFLGKWGSAGSGDGQFAGPGYMAVDPSGNVYVVDQSNHRVQVFDANGIFLGKWGGFGTGNGQFNTALGIALDPSGTIYVADYGGSPAANRIEKFGCPMAFATPTPPSSPTLTPSLTPPSSPTLTPSPTPPSSPTLTPSPTPPSSPTLTPSPTATSIVVVVQPTSTPGGIRDGLIKKDEARVFPNPGPGNAQFTHFAFKMEQGGVATIMVWNSAAQLVAKVSERFEPGQKQLKLTTRDFAPGIYLYQLSIAYDSGGKVLGPIQRFAKRP